MNTSVKIISLTIVLTLLVLGATSVFSHKILSYFLTQNEIIENALISDKGLLYYKSDLNKAEKAFAYFEKEILKTLETEDPNKLAEYRMIQGMQKSLIDLEKYGNPETIYSAIYFSKAHFIDVAFILTGQFEPTQFLETITNDLKLVPQATVTTLTEHSLMISSNSMGQNLIIIVTASDDKVVIATEEAFNGLIERMEKPIKQAGNIFDTRSNDYINMSLDIKNILSSFGMFASLLQLDNPKYSQELNSLSKLSVGNAFNDIEPVFSKDRLVLHTTQPDLYEKHFNDMFNTMGVFVKSDLDKKIVEFLQKNLILSKGDDFVEISLQLDAQKLAFITKAALIKNKEYEQKMLEQQRMMMEQQAPNSPMMPQYGADGIAPHITIEPTPQQNLEQIAPRGENRVSPLRPQMRNEKPK